MTLKQLAETCGKSVPFVLMVQKKYALPPIKEYSAGYAVLISKLIYLELAAVSKKEIVLLLKRERKLLELLGADSVSNSPTWFEDLCSMTSGETRLLVSSYELGHRSGVQTGLDFTERATELFGSAEMGDDTLHALELYTESKESILARLKLANPILSDALKWCRSVTESSATE